MTSVLLLGGAGFIGLNIARELSKRPDYLVTIADNLFRGKLDLALQSLIDQGVALIKMISPVRRHLPP